MYESVSSLSSDSVKVTIFVLKICSYQWICEDDFQPEHSAHSKLLVQEAQTKILIFYPLRKIDIKLFKSSLNEIILVSQE